MSTAREVEGLGPQNVEIAAQASGRREMTGNMADDRQRDDASPQAGDASRSSPEAQDPALEDIGRSLSTMRMMIGRRIIGRMALRQAAPDLEISHLDVIEAVRRNPVDGEATVGAIAETMRIDPSRGSRLVAELVKRGMLRRVASQADARRTVVELTEEAQKLVRQMLSVKEDLIRRIVADWPEEDIDRFAVLFDRFVTGFQARAASEDQLRASEADKKTP